MRNLVIGLSFLVWSILIGYGIYSWKETPIVVKNETQKIDSNIWVSKSLYINLNESNQMLKKELNKQIQINKNNVILQNQVELNIKKNEIVTIKDSINRIDTVNFGKFQVVADLKTTNQDLEAKYQLNQIQPLDLQIITILDEQKGIGTVFVKSDDLDGTKVESQFYLPDKHFYDVILDYPLETTITTALLIILGSLF